jgi:aminoglycoside phosphotransferase (APT) family kinase protein
MSVNNSELAELEQIVGEPIYAVSPGRWGFTNRTDIVTLAGDRRVVVQRYRLREDAEYRLRLMQALHEPAARANISIPTAQKANLEAEPPWALFDPLPGVPVPEAGVVGLEGARFPEMARQMGQLLARWRRLPVTGLALHADWTEPDRLGERAALWVAGIPELNSGQRARAAGVVAEFPALFKDRPVVLAHGDFAPVNVLVSDEKVSGLIDFEAVRLADPLFDPAWWAWSVEFHGLAVLRSAWGPFLEAAEIDGADPLLPDRIRGLQMLRMLEIIGDTHGVGANVRQLIVRRLLAALG